MNTKALSLILGLALLASLGTFYLSQHKSSRVAFDIQNAIRDPSSYSHIDPDELHYRVTLFKDWILQNDKQYSSTELSQRFRAWNQNYEFVQDHNSKNLSWTVEMNKFADLSSEEFGALYTGYNAASYNHEEEDKKIVLLEENFEATETIDWRTKGAVTIIKDQQQCGACYAFASVAGLEGIYYIKKGVLKALSPQQIADCSGSYGNQGCNGGLMTYSYAYTKASGIDTNTDYPWKGATGTCKASSHKAYFKNSGYNNVGASYTQLKTAVKQQPVPVAVEADKSVFQLYKTGVISGTSCGKTLDHAITAVGYSTNGGSDAASNYWIVKNQWGSTWGDKGYVKIKMGSDNVCGINSQATYPTYSG